MEIEASLDRITYQNQKPDGSVWAVCRFYNPNRGDLTAVGTFSQHTLEPGMGFKLIGDWESSKYGRQFRVDQYFIAHPNGRTGTIAFLRQCPGIGEVLAGRIWNVYGEDSIQECIDNPDEVSKRMKLRPELASKLSEVLSAGLASASHKLPLISLLAGVGFPKNTIDLALKEQNDPVSIIKNNPFWLMKFPGCTFSRCDVVRERVGLKHNAKCRISGAAIQVLRNRSSDVWVSKFSFVSHFADLIGFPPDKAKSAVNALVSGGHLLYRDDHVALPQSAKTEDAVAKLLVKHSTAISLYRWPKMNREDDLTEHQTREINLAFENGPLAFLLGGAGSGKTWVTAAVCRRFDPKRVLAAAPTGKAAQRLGESFREAGVSGIRPLTIHRLLGPRPTSGGWVFDIDGRTNFLDADLVVLDEVGMMDNWLAKSVLQAIGPGTLILCVGDPYQLAPVGPGTMLRDWPFWCRKYERFTYGLLTEPMRNAGEIARVANCISGCRFLGIDESNSGNLQIIESKDSEDIQFQILEEARKYCGRADQMQVVTATNHGSPTSKDELNKLLQVILNPTLSGKHEIFRAGDRVINTQNSFFRPVDRFGNSNNESEPEFVANGEVGTVVRSREKLVTVQWSSMPDKEICVPCGTGRGQLDLAYAVTAHKMQGSQAPNVYVAIPTTYKDGMVMDRNWVYTAITRAQEKCTIVGSNDTLKDLVKRSHVWNRKSFLTECMEAHYACRIRENRP